MACINVTLVFRVKYQSHCVVQTSGGSYIPVYFSRVPAAFRCYNPPETLLTVLAKEVVDQLEKLAAKDDCFEKHQKSNYERQVVDICPKVSY